MLFQTFNGCRAPACYLAKVRFVAGKTMNGFSLLYFFIATCANFIILLSYPETHWSQ